jgi:hypothetical protein
VGSFQETSADHVAEGVVFLVESENGGRGKAWNSSSAIAHSPALAMELTSIDLDVDLVLARAEQNGLISMTTLGVFVK